METSTATVATAASSKSRTTALILCIFLGVFGGHRFFVGKIGTGVVWLLTFGCLGVGYWVDLIMILLGKFKDKAGMPVANWK